MYSALPECALLVVVVVEPGTLDDCCANNNNEWIEKIIRLSIYMRASILNVCKVRLSIYLSIHHHFLFLYVMNMLYAIRSWTLLVRSHCVCVCDVLNVYESKQAS